MTTHSPEYPIAQPAVDETVLAQADTLSFKTHLLRTLREDWLLIAISLAYVLSGYVTHWILDTQIVYIRLYSRGLVLTTLFYIFVYLCFHPLGTMIASKGKGPLFRTAWADLKRRFYHTNLILGFVVILVFLPPFMGMFSSYKQAIPKMVPFSWDKTFMQLDYRLHLGHHPGELLQPILGRPVITAIIASCYSLWILVMIGTVLWQSWNENRFVRMQFMLTFMICWILLGTVLATLWSSAGPCYYHLVSGTEGPYQPLNTYLDEVEERFPVCSWSLECREDLWDAYINDKMVRIKGISAMPSMHVSMAVLFALAGWTASRRLGRLLTGYAVIIVIGSIHLSWHYAVDAYVSIILTILIWITVGRLLGRFSRLVDNRRAVPSCGISGSPDR